MLPLEVNKVVQRAGEADHRHSALNRVCSELAAITSEALLYIR